MTKKSQQNELNNSTFSDKVEDSFIEDSCVEVLNIEPNHSIQDESKKQQESKKKSKFSAEDRIDSATYISAYETQQVFSTQTIEQLDSIGHFFNHHKRRYNKSVQDKNYDSESRKKYVKETTFQEINAQCETVERPVMTYRFFAGILNDVTGQHKSIQSNRKNYLNQTIERIEDVEEDIQRLSKKYYKLKDNQEKVPRVDFQEEKNKQLNVLRNLYTKKRHLLLKKEDLKDNKNYNIVFGSKSLLKKRHTLTNENDIQAWKKEWFHRRNLNFNLVGSWDEAFGNSTCQINYRLKQEDSDDNECLKNKTKNKELIKQREISASIHDISFFISIRVPYALESQLGEHIVLENLDIPKYLQVKLKREIDKHKLQLPNKKAISFRFVKHKDKHNVYKLTITLNEENVAIKTNDKKGVIGVDTNADHFAVVDINETGCIQHRFNVPLLLKCKTKHQRKAIIEQGIKEIREYALSVGKDVVIENLDFTKKREELHKNYNKEYARMLSSFAYAQIIMGLQRMEYIHGVKVHKESPAYTSLLGMTIAADKSMTTHQAAAYMIARRYFKLKEKIKNNFKFYHRGQLFTVNVPRRIQALNNLPKLARWFSDVRKYVEGSKLSQKIRNELKNDIVRINYGCPLPKVKI